MNVLYATTAVKVMSVKRSRDTDAVFLRQLKKEEKKAVIYNWILYYIMW